MTDRPALHDRLVDVFKDADVALPANQRGTLADIALDALSSELDTLDRYENTIAWHTTCTSCARILDSSIQETERAERAEAALSQVRALATRLEEFAENALRDDDRKLYTAIANDIRTRTSSEPAPEPARHVHITVHHPDATTANTAALCIADLIRGEYEGSHRLTITTDASDNSQPDQEQPAPPEPVDWQGILRGFQALLDAFPAELHPGGPAVRPRPLPAGLVHRWRENVRAAREQTAADRCCGKPPGAICAHDIAPSADQTTEK